MRTTRCTCALLSVLAAACASEAGPQMEATAATEPVVVAQGLNGPAGVLVDPEGVLWIADAGTDWIWRMRAPSPLPTVLKYAAIDDTCLTRPEFLQRCQCFIRCNGIFCLAALSGGAVPRRWTRLVTGSRPRGRDPVRA
jgi:hypothetical protein